MKKFNFKKLDAFAVNSTGNPAGVIYLNSINDINDTEMLKVADELKNIVSEVMYLFPSDDPKADFKVRYFSSEQEVEFCGHATLAVMYDLFKTNPDFKQKNLVNLQLNKQAITIYNKINQTDSVYMKAPQPEYIDLEIDLNELAAALNIKIESIPDKPEVINIGQDILVVPIANNQTIINLDTNYANLKNFYDNYKIPIINIFSHETNNRDHDLRVRVFAPGYRYLEDLATGSANAALGYYLLKRNLLKKKTIIEQGPSINNPNIIKLEMDESSQLLIGGNATCKISGEYFL